MIEKENIKVGLDFVLPYREFYDKAEEEKYHNRLISGNREWRGQRYYTDIRLAGVDDTVITAYQPIFRVVEITTVANITGVYDVVSIKNIKSANGDFEQIDFSFIEEYGEVVMDKKKMKIL
jgi:hypothetical protein